MKLGVQKEGEREGKEHLDAEWGDSASAKALW